MPLVENEYLAFVKLTRVHGAALSISISDIEAIEERRSSSMPKDGEPARSLGSFIYTYRREYIVSETPAEVWEKINYVMNLPTNGASPQDVESWHGVARTVG